jgi:hypothetical protein
VVRRVRYPAGLLTQRKSRCDSTGSFTAERGFGAMARTMTNSTPHSATSARANDAKRASKAGSICSIEFTFVIKQVAGQRDGEAVSVCF